MSRMILTSIVAITSLVATALLTPLSVVPAYSGSLAPEAKTGLVLVQTKKLRTIAAGRAKLVPQSQRLAIAQRGAGVTCCTNWNTSTGGTGCATFPDSCPSDQFQVDCGADGCW